MYKQGLLKLVFLITLLLGLIPYTHADVYTSGAELEELAKIEDLVLDSLSEYLKTDIERLSLLERYIKDIRDEILESKSKKYNNVNHPLNAFHVIRRFVTAWQEVFNQVGNFSNYNVMRTSLGMVSKYLPNNDDFEGAQRSLIRLQHTYHLRTTDLTNGKVMGKAGRKLSEYDCFLLGQRAMESNESPSTAIEWFEEAKRKASPGYVPLQSQASSALAELYARAQNYHAAVQQAREAFKYSDEDSRLRTLVMVYEKQREAWLQGHPTAGWEPPPSKPDFWIDYEYLCRYSVGKKFKISMDTGERICYYHFIGSSYFPQKVEVLHNSPAILLYHDFISDKEADRLIEYVLPKMQRARVGVTGENEVTDDRIGKIFGILRSEYDWLRIFDRRVEDTFHLSTEPPGGEPIQVLNYGLGGQYYPHYDYDQLNGVKLGGSTVFPEIHLAVPPIKNAALFWYNEKSYGVGDERTLHAGCPVLYGQKWVANKWFREIGHELHRKCDRDFQNTL